MNTELPSTADCWFLTGPTASGKTVVALELASLVGAEIVSLDSMALHRGMDIGTAKPTPAEREAVPHHLVDVLEVDQEFSLAQYVEAAQRAVQEIASRGRMALFVGGTPLYLKALLRGIFAGPPADWTVRRRLQAIAHAEGAESLHARLAAIDPRSAQRLHPRDARRVIRALEVFEKTGRPISDLQRQFDRARPAEACRVFALDWPRRELIGRINARVDSMFERGLVDEVRTLMERRPGMGRTASQALGYREVIGHLQGARDLHQTIELVKLRTRQFAKRQMTWFRSLSECRFVPVSGRRDGLEIADQIRRQVSLPR